MTENPYEKFSYSHFVTLWKMKGIKTAEAYRLTFKNKEEKMPEEEKQEDALEAIDMVAEIPVVKKPIIKGKFGVKKPTTKK